MRVSIFGSRDLIVTERTIAYVRKFVENNFDLRDLDMIVSGGAKGADRLAEFVADDLELVKEIYKADWDKYKKSAGFIRNTDIAERGDAGIALVSKPLRLSKGTFDTYKKMKEKGKRVHVIFLNGTKATIIE